MKNAVGREILAAQLENRAFIERATKGFDEYRASVESYTLGYVERITGVPEDAIRDLAHAYAKAGRAQLCWTLGITEHHNAVVEGLEHLVVQDIFLTKTAEIADVVLPAAASWAESEGTVTSSERRVQRVRKALSPPGNARDDTEILCEVAKRMGHNWGNLRAEDVWDELRHLSPLHTGMSYERLEKLGGLQWPCPDENHPGSRFLHGRLWEKSIQGPRAPFCPVEFVPPVDELNEQYPVRLTTGRRLDSYNTGVQSCGYRSPIRRGETLDLSPEDAERYQVADGETVRVSSRRGSIDVPVKYERGLRPGLAFMSLHFPDQAETNTLTNDVWDPKSGTAEFKATAIRIEKIEATQTD